MYTRICIYIYIFFFLPLLLESPCHPLSQPSRSSKHQAEFPVLHSNFLLASYFTHDNAYIVNATLSMVLFLILPYNCMGFPGAASGKEPTWQCRRHKRHRLRRSPGGDYGNPPQYSCLENSVDRGDWWATVHRIAESETRLKRLSTLAHMYRYFRAMLLNPGFMSNS